MFINKTHLFCSFFSHSFQFTPTPPPDTYTSLYSSKHAIWDPKRFKYQQTQQSSFRWLVDPQQNNNNHNGRTATTITTMASTTTSKKINQHPPHSARTPHYWCQWLHFISYKLILEAKIAFLDRATPSYSAILKPTAEWRGTKLLSYAHGPWSFGSCQLLGWWRGGGDSFKKTIMATINNKQQEECVSFSFRAGLIFISCLQGVNFQDRDDLFFCAPPTPFCNAIIMHLPNDLIRSLHVFWSLHARQVSTMACWMGLVIFFLLVLSPPSAKATNNTPTRTKKQTTTNNKWQTTSNE